MKSLRSSTSTTIGTVAETGAETGAKIGPRSGPKIGAKTAARNRGHDRGRGPVPPRPIPPPSVASASPPMNLTALATAARALLAPELRPAFLGAGSFGGPWSRAD